MLRSLGRLYADAFRGAMLTVVIWTSGEMLALPFSNFLVAHRAAPGRVGEAMGMYMAVFSVALWSRRRSSASG